MNITARFFRRSITSAALTFALGVFHASTQAAPLSISQSPLLVSTTVEPNVMLLIDNSGSMANIIWADGYSTDTTYTDWSDGGSYFSRTSGNNRLANIDVEYSSGTTCGTGGRWVAGKNGGTTKYLCLPDPIGSGNTRYSGNYLNYLFSNYANDADLTQGQIPATYRMQVARDAASSLVGNTGGMRFGVSSFYGPSTYSYGHGATIDAACGSSVSTITAAISGYTPSTNTPLAEALYEITRYFRGVSSYYHDDTSYTSPIQYRCQKNFAIVITDGLPTYDTNFPTDDPADSAETSAALPNWDNLAPTTTSAMYPSFPQYSDGFLTGGENNEGYSLYVDDIAKFAFDIDLKTSGTDVGGANFQDPAFLKQNLNTYTIGFTSANQMLEDAAEYGQGLYLRANTANQLTTALQNAINDVFATSSSASAVASNSTRLNTDTKIYQARFNSLQWNGELIAYPVNSDGSVGAASLNAANNMPTPQNRNIYTYNPNTTPEGVEFTWTGASLPGTTPLSTAQQDALNTDISGTVDNLGIQRLAYLRGDRSQEVQNGGTFRNRADTTGGSPLGDIVNSDPLYVGTGDYRYHLLPDAEGTSYRTFRESSSYKNRTPMLYVGGNDGMLHAFNASTLVEMFAFIPNGVFPRLSALTSPGYSHNYYVDGSARTGDAYIGGGWKTILVSGLGGGGRSIFALDVTSPSSFGANDVLWEFTDDTNLGYTYSQPTIVRLSSGDWAAVFGNGYDSAAHTAQLFLVNLADGTLIKRIDTGVGSAADPNGLSSPAPVDIDGDRITDYVYAGDLYGNMWKFDLSANNSGNWGVAYKQGNTNEPLFRALDSSGNGQPITVRPEIGSHSGSGSEGGIMVYFGTGKYFETNDNMVPENPSAQSFYGIRDNGTRVSNGRSDLQQQTIISEQNVNGWDLRKVSQTAVAASKRGWYLDLVSPVFGAEGERSISNPLLHAGRIIFTTLIPDPDPCSFGGKSWLMELEAETGARLAYPVFDINGDGKVDANDLLPDGTPPSGKSFDGVVPTPNIIGAGEVEYKYMSSSTGNVETVTEQGDSRAARQSWRQLR